MIHCPHILSNSQTTQLVSLTEIHNYLNVTSSAISRDGFHPNSTSQELPGKNKGCTSASEISPGSGPDTDPAPVMLRQLLGSLWTSRRRFPRLPGSVSSAVELLHLHSLGLMAQGFTMNVKAGRSAVLHRKKGGKWRKGARESVWLQQREYEPAVAPVQASLRGSTTPLCIFSVYSF